MKSLQIIVTGKVYKTGYRFFVKQVASVFEISGDIAYSKNNRQVIIRASGEEVKLEKFISFCRLECTGSILKLLRISNSEAAHEKKRLIIFNQHIADKQYKCL